MDFNTTFQKYCHLIEEAIEKLTPHETNEPAILHQAMAYSVKGGGKRLRPTLLLAACDCNKGIHDPVPAAVAIECLHTYSLIHDDLPCMDNSSMRRGKPTCHIKFDQATALLAGDGLLTLSFQIISKEYQLNPLIANSIALELSTASGSKKLIGGQMEDLLGERQENSVERLDFVHRNKTAALIQAALKIGSILSAKPQNQHFASLGYAIGMAFQIIDDILDQTQSSEVLGKPSDQDTEATKTTYPSIYGLEKSKKIAEEYTAEAKKILNSIDGDTAFLNDLIVYMSKRIH